METLVREGGFPVIFLLVFGAFAMTFAVRFAISPSRRFLRISLTLCAATLLTSFNGMFAALAAVGHHAPEYVKQHPGSNLTEVVLLGFAEAMSAGILGFTVLSLTALILALGFWRQEPT